jgi:hypothetical protein
VEKVAPKRGILTYVIFKTLPNVNNRPMGENSPNLVTLMPCQYIGTSALMDFCRTLFLQGTFLLTKAQPYVGCSRQGSPFQGSPKYTQT